MWRNDDGCTHEMRKNADRRCRMNYLIKTYPTPVPLVCLFWNQFLSHTPVGCCVMIPNLIPISLRMVKPEINS